MRLRKDYIIDQYHTKIREIKEKQKTIILNPITSRHEILPLIIAKGCSIVR